MNFLDCSFQNSKLKAQGTAEGNIHASRIENSPVICAAMFIWVIAGLSPFYTMLVYVL